MVNETLREIGTISGTYYLQECNALDSGIAFFPFSDRRASHLRGPHQVGFKDLPGPFDAMPADSRDLGFGAASLTHQDDCRAPKIARLQVFQTATPANHFESVGQRVARNGLTVAVADEGEASSIRLGLF